MTAKMANVNVQLREDSNLKMAPTSVDLVFILSTALNIHMVNIHLRMLRT